jgi:hypothetical protein
MKDSRTEYVVATAASRCNMQPATTNAGGGDLPLSRSIHPTRRSNKKRSGDWGYPRRRAEGKGSEHSAAEGGRKRQSAAECGRKRPIASECGRERLGAAECGRMRPSAADSGRVRRRAARPEKRIGVIINERPWEANGSQQTRHHQQ